MWLHTLDDKESRGLMVVGDAESLRALANQLLLATERFKNEDPWPLEIAVPVTHGPYFDEPNFILSFHLVGTTPIAECLPMTRNKLPSSFFFILIATAILGLITIAQLIRDVFLGRIL